MAQVGSIFGLHMHGFGKSGPVFNASILATYEKLSQTKLLRMLLAADPTGASVREWKAARDVSLIFPSTHKEAWRIVGK